MDHPRYGSIDPEVIDGVAAMRSLHWDATLEGIPEYRARVVEWLAAIEPGPPVSDVSRTVETIETASERRLRLAIYRPTGRTEPLPAYFHIHGGGMISGDIETEAPAMAAITAAIDCVVVSVDYRLAPEHPYPAAIDDCYAGLRWTAEQAAALGIAPNRISVGGESAGGGLAAATALLARDRGGPPIVHQQLIYPMLDDRGLTSSSREFGGGWPGWSREQNLVGWQALLGDLAGGPDVSPYAAPARAAELAGLPSTYIDCGSLEVFRDEDVEYALRLAQAGVAVELHVWPAVVHGWEGAAPDAAVTRQALETRERALRRGVHGSAT